MSRSPPPRDHGRAKCIEEELRIIGQGLADSDNFYLAQIGRLAYAVSGLEWSVLGDLRWS